VVLTGAHAARILWDDRRAVGVAWRRGGLEETARAEGEVLLAAGAFASPQLLMLSGVGPGQHLGRHGIEVRHEMAGVGSDLQDHLQVRMLFRCKRRITLNDAMASVAGRVGMGLRYALFRKGHLTVSAGYAGAFFKTDRRLATPDIQVHFLLFSTDRMGEKLHDFPGFTASVCQLRPESRGTIRLKSANPAAAPLIRPNYLSAERDRRANVEGLKVLRRIMNAPAMAPFMEAEVDPGANVADDAALLAHCRARGGTIYHPAGTCRMGPDARAVVDERLRVKGLERIRVVDGSIMPTLVSGNTNAPIIMIAEKASDMILEDARA
jgi:choline dehydrogenase